MPRNASGTMSNPNSPPVTNTVITVTRAATWESDVVAELSDSLSRSGKGGLTAALRGIDGTLAAPALSFTSETGTGFFRNAASDFRLAIAGVLRWLINATDGHKVISPVADGATAVGHTFDTTVDLANAAAKLGRFSRAGVEKFYLDKDGVIGSKTNLPAVGQQISTSTVIFSGAATTWTDVPPLSISITTTGRPVYVGLQSGAPGTDSARVRCLGAAANYGEFQILRGAASVARTRVMTDVAELPPGVMWALDVPAAGTYTYKLQYQNSIGGLSTEVIRTSLVAYEL